MDEATSTSTLFLMLSALVALGRFAAFAQNPFGAKPSGKSSKTKDKTIGKLSAPGMPVSFLGGPLGFTKWALTSLRLFLDMVFGGAEDQRDANLDNGSSTGRARVSKMHVLLKMLSVSAFVVLGVFVFSNALDDTAWRAPADGAFTPWTSADVEGLSLLEMVGATFACFVALIAINAVFEMISLLSVWWSLRAFEASDDHDTKGAAVTEHTHGAETGSIASFAWRLPIALVVSYVCFFTTLNVAFSAIITLRGIVAGYPLLGDFQVFWQVQWVLFLQESLPRLLHPISEGSAISVGNTNLLAFCVLPLLPAALLLITLASTLILDTVDAASNGAVTERLAKKGERAGPVFTATLVLSMLGGLAALVPT